MSLGAVLALSWVGLVAAGAAQFRTPGTRVPESVSPAAPAGKWVSAVGHQLRQVFGGGTDADADRRVGWTVVAAVPVAALDVRLGLAVGVAVYVLPSVSARRRRLTFELAVARELPEVIDLLRLSLGSGGAMLLALQRVAHRPIGPVSAALGHVCLLVERGHRTADALEGLVTATTADVRPLVRCLLGAEHYGTELMPTLERLAVEARDVRRRRAQTAARRVPIRLLLPLVMCILPAFVLLTLVPTLAGTLDSLDFG